MQTTTSRRAAPIFPLGPEPDALERALEAKVYQKLQQTSPWRRVIRVGDDPAGVSRSEDMPKASHWVTRPFWQFAGPSGWPATAWRPADGSAPTPPSTPTLSTVTAPAYEVFAVARFSSEQVRDLRAIVDAAEAGMIPEGQTALDLAADLLAGALAREEDRAITQGAGTNADPVLGLDQITAITSIVVGPSVEEKLRGLKDSAGFRIFAPDRPIVISNVPVVVSWSLPASATSAKAYIGDWAGVLLIQRLFGPSRPVSVEVSEDYAFQTDEVLVRARLRIGLAAIPGLGAAGIIRLTNIQAP
jgi:hypothetical protein